MLDDAIAEFPIVSYLQQHTVVNGQPGEQIRAVCPFCNRKRSLSISREKKLFYCFKCAEANGAPDVWNGKANLLQFIQLVEQCSKSSAFKRIYQLSGLPEPEFVPRAKPTSLIPEGPEIVPLRSTGPNEVARKYLEKRGVGHLIDISYVSIGGKYNDRVILPLNYRGELTGAECKALKKQTPKSLYHALEASQSVYTCLGWDDTQDSALVTESVIDAETTHGLINSVGTYGAGLTEGQVLALLNLGVEKLFFAWDGDAKAKTVKTIQTKTYDLFRNYVVPFVDNEDPNSIGKDEMAKRLVGAKEITSEWELLEMTAETL